MGGLGSGRVKAHSKRHTVENSLIFDIRTLNRQTNWLRTDCPQSGIYSWSNAWTKERLASVSVAINLEDRTHGQMMLR